MIDAKTGILQSIAVGLALACTSAFAQPTGRQPSFDCAKAVRPSERIVCADAGLSALDHRLAAAYAKGLSAASDWTEADRNASRSAQRAWLRQRERCAQANDPTPCVRSAYERRIAELQIRNGDAGPAPTPVAYLCPDLTNAPVTVVYYGSTEPPSAVITVGDRQVVAFIARSGSGARYEASGVELWEHHGEARLTWMGRTRVCRVV